eukprot:COSAG06_NODE_6927_length_2712_cov_3.797168_4_plen_128_part_00
MKQGIGDTLQQDGDGEGQTRTWFHVPQSFSVVSNPTPLKTQNCRASVWSCAQRSRTLEANETDHHYSEFRFCPIAIAWIMSRCMHSEMRSETSAFVVVRLIQLPIVLIDCSPGLEARIEPFVVVYRL